MARNSIGHGRFGIGTVRGTLGVLVAGATLVAGLAGVLPAAADGAPSFPLVNVDGTQMVGLVAVGTGGGVTQLSISLWGLRPYTTYIVSDCQADITAAIASCDGSASVDGVTIDPSLNAVTTDGLGNAQQLVEFFNAPASDFVQLVNSANANDSYTAAVSAHAFVSAGMFN